MKKQFVIYFIIVCLAALAASCDAASTSEVNNGTDAVTGDESVVLPADIDSEAMKEGEFPDDATVVDTSMNIEGTAVAGKESTQQADSEDDTLDASVKIPSSLSRLTRLEIPEIPDVDVSDYVSLKIWLNGRLISIKDAVSFGKEVKLTINLREGDNYFCFLFTLLGADFRSPVVKIKALAGDEEIGAIESETELLK